ncbi:hypothetical protein F2Q69_00000278 [Brassica cretica]|uniref:Uncharacterized protein n=1 Tax=Brassica cretica TaxID=69181 RepID=A0A8S9P3E9_BRACR|nr:hypothetical protein F2Q69_00000278 [Brassica cretica]
MVDAFLFRLEEQIQSRLQNLFELKDFEWLVDGRKVAAIRVKILKEFSSLLKDIEVCGCCLNECDSNSRKMMIDLLCWSSPEAASL